MNHSQPIPLPIADLTWTDGHTQGPSYPVGARATLIGRAATCDVVVTDPAVSRRHLAIWARGAEVWVEDLRTRNGTWVDGERIHTTTRVGDGSRIQLAERGPALTLTTRPGVTPPRPHGQRFALEDRTTGARYRLGAGPFRIGGAPGADLHLAHVDASTVSLLKVQRGGEEIWLGHGEDTEEITVGETFRLHGTPLRVVPLPPVLDATRPSDAIPWPYALRASAQDGRIRTTLRDLRSGRHTTLEQTNRAILLYLAARRWHQDAAEGRPPEERGWVTNADAVVGVWGRHGEPRQLKVLVCRTRNQLREAGFDPWCLERRRGALRVDVERVELEEPGAS